MTTVVLFPGQGSQKVGMGKALTQAFPSAKRVFDEADQVLGFALSKLCFEGPEAELTLTENTQPAILTTSIAALSVARERGLTFDVAAGHSLGEWSAVVAAGGLTFADAVKLVKLRGKAMQEAVPAGRGSMAAILGLAADGVAAACEESKQGQVVQPANFNGGDQIVISGDAAAVERAMEACKKRGAQRAVPLHVSAPFHCALMQPAADRMQAALKDTAIADLSVPVVANVTAEPYRTAAEVRERLVKQITGSVRWEQSIQWMRPNGVTRGYEVGHGAVLRGLCRRIDRELALAGLSEPADIDKEFPR
jgi:[acyl-carrier-protein] S-malonyltransferase